jgi:hypothetical protein
MMLAVVPPIGHRGKGKTPPSMMLVVIPPTGCHGKGKAMALRIQVRIPSTCTSKSDACDKLARVPATMLLARKLRKHGYTSWKREAACSQDAPGLMVLFGRMLAQLFGGREGFKGPENNNIHPNPASNQLTSWF